MPFSFVQAIQQKNDEMLDDPDGESQAELIA